MRYCEYKNKICFKDQRGAALLNVLLITTFVMILASTIASMAMTSYRLKLINYGSKENFYKCEAALEQLRVGFKNELNTLKEGSTEAKALKSFYEGYKNNYLTWTVSEDGTSGKGAYSVKTLSRLIDNIAGYKVTNYDSNSDETKCELSFEDESIKVTISTENTNSGLVLSNSGVVFSDIKVTYEEDGYQNSITTDIEVGFGEDGSSDEGTGGGVTGWVTRTDEGDGTGDRIKTLKEFKEEYSIESNSKYDFGTENVPYKEDDAVYISTTDYPVNSITYVTYSLPVADWTACHVPKVVAQCGFGDSASYGTGTQYSPTEDCDNIYICVGDDATNDSNWIAYTSVFDYKNKTLKEDRDERYDSYYSGKDYITFAIKLQKNALGWIYLSGESSKNGYYEGNLKPYKDLEGKYKNVYIYVDLDDKPNTTEIVSSAKKTSNSSTMYNKDGLTKQLDGNYEDSYGNIYIWKNDYLLTVKAKCDNNSNSQIYSGYYLGEGIVKDWSSSNSINISGLGLNICGNGDTIECDGSYVTVTHHSYQDSEKYYIKTYCHEIELDLSNSNYLVGDKLILTIDKVDADKIMKLYNNDNVYVNGTAWGYGNAEFEIEQVDWNTINLTITTTWNMCPSLKISNLWTYGTTEEELKSNITATWDLSGREKTNGGNSSGNLSGGSDSEDDTDAASKASVVTYSNWRQE